MILASNGIEIPEYWYHDALLKNNFGFTVAMLQAFCGIIPPK